MVIKNFYALLLLKTAISRYQKSSLHSSQDYIVKYVTLNLQFNNQTLEVSHDCLGHLGSSMMHRIIENSIGHPFKNQKILSRDFCVVCTKGKLITRSLLSKVITESPVFLQRIQGDTWGPIHPTCGRFRYFIVLIDASTRWSYVSLLSTRNLAFAKLLTQIIKLRVQFPDYPIKAIRLDNASEFTS